MQVSWSLLAIWLLSPLGMTNRQLEQTHGQDTTLFPTILSPTTHLEVLLDFYSLVSLIQTSPQVLSILPPSLSNPSRTLPPQHSHPTAGCILPHTVASKLILLLLSSPSTPFFVQQPEVCYKYKSDHACSFLDHFRTPPHCICKKAHSPYKVCKPHPAGSGLTSGFPPPLLWPTTLLPRLPHTLFLFTLLLYPLLQVLLFPTNLSWLIAQAFPVTPQYDHVAFEEQVQLWTLFIYWFDLFTLLNLSFQPLLSTHKLNLH